LHPLKGCNDSIAATWAALSPLRRKVDLARKSFGRLSIRNCVPVGTIPESRVPKFLTK
jgi:hypothetical protein